MITVTDDTREKRPKVVWIVNHYAPFLNKDGWSGLHVQIARALKASSWRVTVIAASTSHPTGRQHAPTKSVVTAVSEGGTSSYWLRTPEYSGNGWKRIRNMAVFGLRLLDPRAHAALPRPDVVIGRVVNPAAAAVAAGIARIRQVPFVLEISDIWPDTLVQLGKMKPRGLPARALGTLETLLIRQSSGIISPLPYIDRYLSDKGLTRPFHWIPNGIDEPETLPEPTARDTLTELHLAYVGSLGNANGVDTIVEAWARYLQLGGVGHLEILGNGPLRKQLEDMVSELGLDESVSFVGRVPRDKVIERMQSADALVANMRDLPLYKYGVALNKLFDYLLAAKPVIFASNAANNIIENADAGITVSADSCEELASAFLRMKDAPQEQRLSWGTSGRSHVVSMYTYEKSALAFARMLDQVSKRGVGG